MHYSDYNRGYDEGFVASNKQHSANVTRLRQTEMKNEELVAAIRENSVVLLHIAAATKDETLAALIQGVHDSLTDAL